MRNLIAGVVLAATLGAAGCAATLATDPYPPDLVYVSPGVQVIADYNEPIFYSDGYYWRNYGGAWYRSYRYTGGWAYATPPVAVLRIDRPHSYVHYRPQGYVGRTGRVAPAPGPAPGWRGGAVAAPQRVAPAPRPAYPPPAAVHRGPPPSAPAPAHPAPGPAPRGNGGGWRGR